MTRSVKANKREKILSYFSKCGGLAALKRVCPFPRLLMRNARTADINSTARTAVWQAEVALRDSVKQVVTGRLLVLILRQKDKPGKGGALEQGSSPEGLSLIIQMHPEYNQQSH